MRLLRFFKLNARSQHFKISKPRIKKGFFALTTSPEIRIILLDELWFVLKSASRLRILPPFAGVSINPYRTKNLL